jgi:MFS family permease
VTAAAHRNPGPRRRLPRGVWVLGFVSMLMDISSEIIHSVLPLFLVGVLGLPVVAVGLIEGVAEATAQVTKAFSGALSDRIGKRKLLAVIGYGLAAATKPIFPLASGAGLILFARFVDRLGKGIRGAPRDALIADIVPEESRGAGFGLRQTLDSVGAVAGPLLAVGLLALTSDNFRAVMWAAVVPAVLCVVLLVKGVEEPAIAKVPGPRPKMFHSPTLRALGAPFWALIAIATVLTLPRFSEAFLLLRVSNLGLAVEFVPLVYVAMNVVYSLAAYPAGILSDAIGRRRLVAIGFLMLAISQAVLAGAEAPAAVFAGAALWGLHLALTQGIFAAMVADVAPAHLRGTGFGLFNMATGLALFAGSLIAGLLWDYFGPAAPFAVGTAVTVLSLIVYPLLPLRPRERG